MNCVVMISGGEGHLDLGGGGVMALLREVIGRGHRVTVMSKPRILKKLGDLDVKHEPFEEMDELMLYSEQYDFPGLREFHLLALKAIELKLLSLSPDLVLCDRILGLADLIFRKNGIRWVTLGMNGSLWKKTLKFVVMPGESAQNKLGLGYRYNQLLGMPISQLSAYSQSPFLNVAFMPEDYYPSSDLPASYVSRFSDRVFEKSEVKVGISLGNGTFDPESFVKRLGTIVQAFADDFPIYVFGDKHKELIQGELKHFKNLHFLGFVDFHEHFPSLSHLIFPGGIGTLWYCFEYQVIPLVISGEIHDQTFNGIRAKELLDLNYMDVFSDFQQYTHKLRQWKLNGKYTDTLRSVVEKIERSQL